MQIKVATATITPPSNPISFSEIFVYTVPPNQVPQPIPRLKIPEKIAIDVFADRNEVFGEFPFPAFIDLFFDVAFLTYPKEHDSGESRAQWTNVYRKNIHPCGDDALNQK